MARTSTSPATSRRASPSSSASLWFSANPGKRAAERWYLIYTPIWGALAGLVMVTGIGKRISLTAWSDPFFLAHAVSLWALVLLGGFVFRAPEDAGKPWWRLYHTKYQLWMFVFAFFGNWWSEYFYEILHMHYGFRTTWNLNSVPFFLYVMTVTYFTTYGTLINVVRRRTLAALGPSAPPWLRAAAWLPVCFAVAFLESVLNANPRAHDLFCYEDMTFVLTFGTFIYGLWFVVSAPFWFPIDEERSTDTSYREVLVSVLAAFMLVLAVNETVRSFVAPLVTTVERGAKNLDKFGTSCLGPS